MDSSSVRYFRELLRPNRQIFIEGFDCGELARTRGRADAGIYGLRRLTVICEIGKEIKNISNRYRFYKIKVDIADGDVFQRRRIRHLVFHQHHKPQKHPQIKIIFLNRLLGLALDRFMVGQKFAEDLRTIRVAFHLGKPPFREIKKCHSVCENCRNHLVQHMQRNRRCICSTERCRNTQRCILIAFSETKVRQSPCRDSIVAAFQPIMLV